MKFKIYAEGGGPGELANAQVRKAWHEFFEAAGLKGHMPGIVRGQGRRQTYDLFKTAIANPTPDTIPLLLVDSEAAVAPNHTVWQHLKSRDNWDQPPGAGEDDAFLMVQVMETWLLADREMLRRFFGPSFNEHAFAEWQDLESIPKPAVFSALEKATRQCKTSYAKGAVTFELLSMVDPAKVEQRCSHARRLLDRLRGI